MTIERMPPWKRKRKGGARRPLSPQQLEAARLRAQSAGRRYPNLVDNMWAARHIVESAAGDDDPK